jgi:hypothetical protein
MSSIGDMIRQADEQLRAQVDVAAGLASASATERLDEAPSLLDAAAAARRALAERRRALETAQLRVRQLDKAIEHLSRVAPFLTEGWADQRAVIAEAMGRDTEEGLASWLNYWFAAASSRRIDALLRLQSDVALPAAAAIVAERMSVAARALAAKDWSLCRAVLEIGSHGVPVGAREVPDRTAQDDRESTSPVREDLRLLSARLALHHRLADAAGALLDAADQDQPTAPRLALRSRSARLRGADREADALLRQARDLDPRDLDVTTESIAQARRRRELGTALDHARSAIGSLLSLRDIDADLARLVDPPAELWIAVAERAGDEGDRDGARRFLHLAAEVAPRDDDEIAATIAEQRADLASSPAERRRALLSCGERRIGLGQLERARRDYQAAVSVRPADRPDEDDARVRAWAQLRWADVVSADAQQRPYRDVADELSRALDELLAAQPQVDVSGVESWSYLTESDLRLQLSKAPHRYDRDEHQWAALRAAARAVALNPGWARPWLTLAGAAAGCDLYRVAEAAARRAHEIEADDTTRAGYVQALVNVGRYEDAQALLGNAADAWSQCIRGLVATRRGHPDEAVGHFAAATIDPAWFWAWPSYICALILSGDLASARLKSRAFLNAAADREGERAWLSAASCDARVHGQLDAALDLADRLGEAAGPYDPAALRALGQTLVLRQDRTGWALLARALATDPLPTAGQTWDQQEGPVLTALAADQGVTLTPADLDLARRRLLARPHPSDPLTELRWAAAAPAVPDVAAGAARLTEAALRAAADSASPPDRTLEELIARLAAEDGLDAEAESLRRHLTGSTQQPAEPAGPPDQDGAHAAAFPLLLRLRLPTSWLAGSEDPGREHQLLLRYAPIPRPGRPRDAPRTAVSAGDDLEPDGYEILADDAVWSSGRVDPRLRYCPRETLSLLPERARTDPRTVATAEGWGVPPDVLDADRGLAALLTLSAAEVVALRYRDAARDLDVPLEAPSDDERRATGEDTPPAPADLPPTLTHALAHRRWQLRGSPDGSYADALADWDAAQRLRYQLVAETAYLRWLDRGQPHGDAWADWFAAETETGPGGMPEGQVSGPSVDERLRRTLAEETAYYRWIDRGRPLGDPLTDWAASDDDDEDEDDD